MAYVSCCVLNSLVLVMFVSVFRFDHRLVQAICIIFAGITLYFVQKLWVFAKAPFRESRGARFQMPAGPSAVTHSVDSQEAKNV